MRKRAVIFWPKSEVENFWIILLGRGKKTVRSGQSIQCDKPFLTSILYTKLINNISNYKYNKKIKNALLL